IRPPCRRQGGLISSHRSLPSLFHGMPRTAGTSLLSKLPPSSNFRLAAIAGRSCTYKAKTRRGVSGTPMLFIERKRSCPDADQEHFFGVLFGVERGSERVRDLHQP